MWPWWGFIVERPFYIISEMKSKRHLTMFKEWNDKFSMIKTPNGNLSQKFVFDGSTRTIRMASKKANSLQYKNNYDVGNGGRLAIPDEQFKYEKGYIISVTLGKVFTVLGGKDAENQKVVVANRNNKVEQRWRIVYVDQYK
jgi:hypothetical protein